MTLCTEMQVTFIHFPHTGAQNISKLVCYCCIVLLYEMSEAKTTTHEKTKRE